MLETVWSPECQSHSHFFLTCVKLKTFRDNIFKTTELIQSYAVPRDPAIFLLGLLPAKIFEKEDKYLFKILSVASRKAITRSLMQTDPPCLNHWLDIIEEIYIM